MRNFNFFLIFISLILCGCRSSIETSVMHLDGENIYKYKYIYITEERNETEQSLEAKKYIANYMTKKGYNLIQELTPEDSINTISFLYKSSHRKSWNEGEKPYYEYMEQIIFYNLKNNNTVAAGRCEVEGRKEYDYKKLIDKTLNTMLK